MPARSKTPAAAPPAVTIRVQRKASRKDLKFVWSGLRRFNRQVVSDHPYAHFLVEARSPRGALLGGLQGVVYYQWLFVANFFLSERIRRGGIGAKLIAAAERHAQSLGCHGVWLDTFAWQARPFYEKQGYRVFGSLPDYPTGHERWFMMKALGPAAETATDPPRRPATPMRTRRASAGRPARP
ncbi:MAG TPA: GNAT family N-acetyltransferase [Vineibacter sp.]|nr:GNAT family N-acetyltransferase [Vineibacter sp.]